MAAPETNWLPGLLVFAAGVVGSLAYLFVAKRGGPEAAAPSDDLDARYQGVIAELKEHVANKHLLPADSWEAEKRRLEALAVQLLKQRDAQNHESLKAEARAEKKAQAAAADTGLLAQQPQLKGALLGGAVVLFFAVLWFSLNEATRPRTEGMGVTGMNPGGGEQPVAEQPATPEDDQRLQALLGAVQRTPDDIDALAEAGLYLISKQAFGESRPFVQRATMLDPFHVKARVCRAILVAVDGDVATSMNELERLGTLYADGWPAWLYAGMLSMDQNDPARAVQNFERYLATAPPTDVPPMLRMAISQIKQQMAGARPAQ
ncbi:MAG: hypothetical protein JNJ54_12825 [Myxococcaceae bacterium]|nr:hypothetical protein [Myxococcaceae bacterium]